MQAEKVCHAGNRVTNEQPKTTIEHATIICLRVRSQTGDLQVPGRNFLEAG